MNIKENFDKIIDGDTVEVGYPMTPGRWADNSQEMRDGMLITVSCGGGLGGSRWDEVVVGDKFPTIEGAGLVELTRNNGQTFLLNPRNIVKIEFVNIVSAVFINENSNYELGEWKFYWLLRRNIPVNFVSKWIYRER